MASYVPSLANWDALLQEDYVAGKIAAAINTATPFRDTLKRSATTSGRERVRAVKVGASQGQGARREMGALPSYGAGEYKNATTTAKYNYAPFKISGPAEEFGSEKAFVDFGMQIVKDNQEGLRLFTGRQCWGDGQGILALVNNGAGYAAGSTVITVDSAYGVLWGSLSTNTTFLLKRNMEVQFGSEDNSGLGYTISSLSSTTITISPALVNAIADNAAITMKASGAVGTGTSVEIEGILKLAATAAFQTTLGLGTTVYHGIDRTTYSEWEGNVVNVAAALSLAGIRTARDTVYKRTDDEQTNLFMASTEIARDYEALLTPAQRFTGVSKDGGTSALEHDGLRVSKDSKAPVKAFFLADTTAVEWMQTRDPHWLQDGSGIMRVVPGQDAKEALLKWYANLDAEQPRRFLIAYNVTVS
jgi:hypothetical protein